MSKYDFDRIGPLVFEEMIQSLCQGIFGSACEIYGSGADGQREITFEGNTNIFGIALTGKTFGQAKYKETKKEKDLTWLKKVIADEFKRFNEKMQNDAIFLPDNYYIFTNVVLTPVKDIGVKDQINKFVKQYSNIIKNIYILGYNEICALLDNNRNVATSYASYLLSGDILMKLFNESEERESEKNQTLFRYIEKEFRDDASSRMEQAGSLIDNQIPLEKIFVDLQATNDGLPNTEIGFAARVINLGNKLLRETNKLDNGFVLLGNAGQGKSTICQFICQIYRALFINHYADKTNDNKINNFIREFHETYNYDITCLRIPIRIVLKEYADWASRQEKIDSSTSVISYILFRIKKKANGNVEDRDFRLLLKSYSWIFVFDGLDEVPASSNRNEILIEISQFISVDLVQAKSDSLFIATSRPQGYNDNFDSIIRQHLQLVEMNDEICIRYLKKLIGLLEVNEDKQTIYLDTLRESLSDEIISKLMRTPLQATIVAILVKTGGKPPKDKYALFLEYYLTILNREKQKRVIETLNSELSWIDDIHYAIAFNLQIESERSSNSAAVLNKIDLMNIINTYIKGKYDLSVTQETINEKTKLLFEIIICRLTFITEIQDDYFGFAIRSIQEFLAANAIVKNRDEKEITEIIRKISCNSYWRNVALFTFGYINKERLHMENYIDSYCNELNGSNLEVTGNSISLAGSWLAFDILRDGVFKSNPRVENKYLTHIAKLLDLSPSIQLLQLSKLSTDLVNKLTRLFIIPKIQLKPLQYNCWYLLGSFLKAGHTQTETIITDNWPIDVVEQNQIITIFLDLKFLSESSSWLINKISILVTNSKIIIRVFPVELEKIAKYLCQTNEMTVNMGHMILSNMLINVGTIPYEISYKIYTQLFGVDVSVILALLGLKKDIFDEDDRNVWKIVKNHNISICKIKTINIEDENCILIRALFEKYNCYTWGAVIDFLLVPSFENLYSLVDSYKTESKEILFDLKKILVSVNWVFEFLFKDTQLMSKPTADIVDSIKDIFDGMTILEKESKIIEQLETKNLRSIQYGDLFRFTRSTINKIDDSEKPEDHNPFVTYSEVVEATQVDFGKLCEYSPLFVSDLLFCAGYCISEHYSDSSPKKHVISNNIIKLYEYYQKNEMRKSPVDIWVRKIFIGMQIEKIFNIHPTSFDFFREFDSLNFKGRNTYSNDQLRSAINNVIYSINQCQSIALLRALPYLIFIFSKTNYSVGELITLNTISKIEVDKISSMGYAEYNLMTYNNDQADAKQIDEWMNMIDFQLNTSIELLIQCIDNSNININIKNSIMVKMYMKIIDSNNILNPKASYQAKIENILLQISANTNTGMEYYKMLQ